MATPIDKQTAALHVSLEFTGNSLFLFREQQVRHLAVIYANTPFPHHAIFHSQNSQREWGFFFIKMKANGPSLGILHHLSRDGDEELNTDYEN